ncbi:antirestriction protein ArdA [Schaalia cardiffensis]|uniref:antirestriction protein ArdA n=1 Tax=Schaalia cardiffensis TaxID=181487 RepID=UPI002AAF3C99|nr:antirestriction protein ArdA [Schaalia cardiffensis]
MSCSTVTIASPRVWVGCLSCYNEGRLVGEWVDAEGAGDLTSDDLHGTPTTHEELWVFDLEGFPRGIGEMSPSAAVPWGDLFEEVGEAQWPALLAWVETGCYVADSDDLPCASDFEDRFCGCWDSESDYASHLAEELGIWDEVPAHLHSYFNLDAWWGDERHDYTIADAPDGGIYVFRSY